MYCSICGKKIQEGNNLCHDCQIKHNKAFSVNAQSNDQASLILKKANETTINQINNQNQENSENAKPEALEDNEENYQRRAKKIRKAKIIVVLLSIAISIWLILSAGSDDEAGAAGMGIALAIIPGSGFILNIIYFIDLINKLIRKKKKPISIIYSLIFCIPCSCMYVMGAIIFGLIDLIYLIIH